jgi:hypothetical protein
MLLITNPEYRIRDNNERIHKKDLLYAMTNKGTINWCQPSKQTTGKKWKKHNPYSPSIVMTKIKRKQKK